MSQILDEVLTANSAYAAGFAGKASLPIPPARHFAILTCMDARLDPAKFAGLAEGDAHVIRNPGGRATDEAILALVVSYKLLGTREWFVIHHTHCGMELFNKETMRDLLTEMPDFSDHEHCTSDESGAPAPSGDGELTEWLTIARPQDALISDIRRIRAHPLVPADVPIYGYIFDVKTGSLIEVPAATQVALPASRGDHPDFRPPATSPRPATSSSSARFHGSIIDYFFPRIGFA